MYLPKAVLELDGTVKKRASTPCRPELQELPRYALLCVRQPVDVAIYIRNHQRDRSAGRKEKISRIDY
jgi:hypothetical protein